MLQRTGHAALRHPGGSAPGSTARFEILIFGGLGPTPTSDNVFSNQLVVLNTKTCASRRYAATV